MRNCFNLGTLVSDNQEEIMNRTELLASFFIATVGLVGFQFTDRTAPAQAKNDQAPSFTVKLLNGEDFKSSDLKGKVAVLKFVSSY